MIDNKENGEVRAIAEFLKIIRPEIERMGYKIVDQKRLSYANYCNKIDKAGNGIKDEKSKNVYVTDALIYRELENGEAIPLVVVEGKIKDYTTHDVITYSEKSKAHKSVFPHLQYGFLVLDAREKEFKKRYYVHQQFDFEEIFPLNELDEERRERIKRFVSQLKNQIETAEKKYALFFESREE